jgi:hypothetical protein
MIGQQQQDNKQAADASAGLASSGVLLREHCIWWLINKSKQAEQQGLLADGGRTSRTLNTPYMVTAVLLLL